MSLRLLPRGSLVLVLAALSMSCSKKGGLGGSCAGDKDCNAGLFCYRDECLQEGSVRHMREADARRKAGEDDDRAPGDRIEVESRGAYRPARIVGVVGRGSYRVRLEGQDASWDEIVSEARIRGGKKSGRAGAAAPAPSDG